MEARGEPDVAGEEIGEAEDDAGHGAAVEGAEAEGLVGEVERGEEECRNEEAEEERTVPEELEGDGAAGGLFDDAVGGEGDSAKREHAEDAGGLEA
jgi:hypothetical protein